MSLPGKGCILGLRSLLFGCCLHSLSAETLTTQNLNANIWNKTLPLPKANKRVVDFESIYQDFILEATNSNTALADGFMGKTTPNLCSATGQFIENIYENFCCGSLPSSQKLKLQCLLPREQLQHSFKTTITVEMQEAKGHRHDTTVHFCYGC